MKPELDLCLARRDNKSAFTLTELVAVVAVLLVFAVFLAPALAKSRVTDDAVVCLNNQRRLMQSWLLYTDDFEGRVVNNTGIPATIDTIQSGQFKNWANNVMTWGATGSMQDISNTNLDWATKGLLVRYGKGAIDIYRCPADTYLSAQQRARGWDSRLRSVSMSAFFGRFDPSNPNDPTLQGKNWLLPQFRQFMKLADVPNPAMTWVAIDEHADSINDGYFVNDPSAISWQDLPASYHDGGCSFGLADGHSEIRRWLSVTSVYPVGFFYTVRPFDALGRQDFAWYKDRTGYLRLP